MGVLTAFYSLKGENLGEGWEIVNLEKGYTARAAEAVQRAVGVDLFEIETVTPYPASHRATVAQSRGEIERGFLPELRGLPADYARYETVFLCYPIWWFTVPPAVASFASALDWRGKRVIPLSTSHASGSANSIRDLRRLCKGAVVDDGSEVLGQHVAQLERQIGERARAQLAQ